ncbi:MAG TPA: EamA family transporter [Candidatus Binatia bacterium]|nr:EamA family transporter [Candidatus Binatia bacterium]
MTSDAIAQLIALVTSIWYACALVSSRRGLRYSTPTTVTLISILVQNVSLWSAVFLSGGIPDVSWIAIALFCVVGLFQMGVRLFAYTGVLKIGASRSSALQSINPLIAAAIAVTVLQETVTALIISGTLLVVIGIILVSWKAERELPSFRWWHLLLPVAAACLTGMNHPIRRYALSLSNEPLFFSAFMGFVSLVGFLIYLAVSPQEQRLVWDRRAFWPFLCTGIFETLSIVFIITALSIGRVVVIAPIAATYPVWALVGTKLFLRDVERINVKTVVGILSVVAGTVAIHLGR